MPSDARAVILAAVKGSSVAGTAEAAWARIPREYDRATTGSAGELEHLLTERLRDYDAQVLASTVEALPASIAGMLAKRGAQRMLVPSGFDTARLPPGFDFVLASGLSPTEMNGFDGVLTESTLAIAETGTIVLQNAPGQGSRSATLVPDYHLCMVLSSQIVQTVPEAILKLRPTATLPTTFVSGPSATADIEMTRIKGVHGPRFLDVILITG